MEHRNREEGLPLQGVWLHTFVVFGGFFGVPALVTWLFVSLMPSSFRTPRGPVGAARTQINDFKTALEPYRLDHGGKVPTTQQGLATLIRPSRFSSDSRWNGPYLCDVTRVPLDPWQHTYVYKSPAPSGEPYEITSYGADGKPGGDGDDEDIGSVRR